MTSGGLQGSRILILEDDYHQAAELKSLLEQAGAEIVGPTAHADEVLGLLEGDRPDAAVLDINLGFGANFDLAYRLQQERVPFLFLTGYDRSVIPEDFRDIWRIEKPADAVQLLKHLESLTSG